MKTIRYVSLAVLAVAASPLMEKPGFADVKWGVDGNVTTGYDDNISYSNTNRIGDMITRAILDTGLTQQGKDDTLAVKGGVTENVYTSHSSLDNLAEALDGDYKIDLSPYEHLKVTDVFAHSVDPSNLQNAFGRVNGSYDTFYNNLDVESVTNITEQWSATVRYKQLSYDFTTTSLSDYIGYNPGISTEYDFSSQSQATVNYDYRRNEFTPGQGVTANTPSLGWRQYLTTQWYVDLLAGLDFLQGFGENTVHPRYGASLTNDVDENTSLSLKYDKQYETDPYTKDIDNDWHAALSAVHQFTDRFSGVIAFFTGQSKYIVTNINYTFVGTNTTLKYALNEHVDLTLSYSLQDGVSNSSSRAVINNTILAGISFKF